MQTIFRQTKQEELREIEKTIDKALEDYFKAKKDDNEKMVQQASAVINAELERLEELKLIDSEIRLTTEKIQ